jgi:hypothetical protein
VTPLERLLAETIPTGQFGGPHHRDPEPAPEQHPARPRRETTALEAAEHRRVLEAALDEKPARHLRAVPAA